MEEARNYIETGILELYVLGDVTPHERQQVEQMMALHPSIMAEVTEIERALESYAAVNAVAPSEKQRDKILNSLLINLGDDRTFTSKKAPAEGNVVVMQSPKTINFYKYAFAASLALLVGSAIAIYNMHNQLQESNMQLAVLAAQNQQITKTVSFKDQQLADKDNQINASSSQLAAAIAAQKTPIAKISPLSSQQLVVFRDTSYRLLRLKPVQTAKNQSASMMVAWSPVKKKVIIDMLASNMPKNDRAHQYQLWALVGGKPIDLGVFDKTDDDSVDMKQMKSISTADAFAVTLEPRGGSINPTMSELMVVGANSK